MTISGGQAQQGRGGGRDCAGGHRGDCDQHGARSPRAQQPAAGEEVQEDNQRRLRESAQDEGEKRGV